MGVVIAVAGLLAGMAWGLASYRSYLDKVDGFARTTGPGTAMVTIGLAGSRTLYYEGPRSPTLSQLDVRIVAPDGSAVAINRYSGDLRYDAPDGTVGRAIGTFAAPTAGAYQLTAGGAISQEAHLAIGEGISASTIASILGALFLIGATFFAGLIVVIVTAARRSRS